MYGIIHPDQGQPKPQSWCTKQWLFNFTTLSLSLSCHFWRMWMLSEINKRLCELILSRISKFLKTIFFFFFLKVKYFLFAFIAITSIKCDLQVLEVDIIFALLNLYIFPFPFISLVPPYWHSLEFNEGNGRTHRDPGYLGCLCWVS